MPVLFQLLQCRSFALSFSARYRHVALGFSGTWNRGIFAGEYGKGYPGQCQSQSEQYTKINESAFAKATADRFCGAFRFHYWNLGLCERILEESRRFGLALRGVDALDSGDLKMQGMPF
jgi:hypothetical protein